MNTLIVTAGEGVVLGQPIYDKLNATRPKTAKTGTNSFYVYQRIDDLTDRVLSSVDGADCLVIILSAASGIPGTAAFQYEEFLFTYAAELDIPCVLINGREDPVNAPHFKKHGDTVKLFVGINPDVCTDAARSYPGARVLPPMTDLLSDRCKRVEEAALRVIDEIGLAARNRVVRAA